VRHPTQIEKVDLSAEPLRPTGPTKAPKKNHSNLRILFTLAIAMNRKTSFLFLAVLLFQTATAHAENIKDALDHKYKNHLLALRTPFSSGSHEFDSDGHLLSAPAQGAWLVYGGIYVEKLDLSGDTLRLEGPRGALSYSEKDGKPILIAFSKPVRIEIHLLQSLNSLDDAETVLSRVFYLGKDWAEHAKPEFRLAKDSTSGEAIYHAGQDHTKFPRPVQTPLPDFSEKARKAKYQATALMTIVVDKSGNVTRIRIDRAAGMDLDDRAVERVKTWRFEPATRDGQRVAVEMPIEVSFNLY
jgi:TonB family protein